MKIQEYSDGIVICADSTDKNVIQFVNQKIDQVPLIIADPPYGNIVKEKWDRVTSTDKQFAEWMLEWTNAWSDTCLIPGGAFYVWGGVGKPGFRPFLHYLTNVEKKGSFELANLITWSKKRAYGVNNNYLWTREECAYFVKGDSKKPKCFNVPLLSVKRGYSGYNKNYPAKSEFFRRTNVWTDINELFRGKIHPTQKTQKLHEVMIEIHTAPGEYVIDPFAGAGTTALAARKLNRKFVVIESDESCFDKVVKVLNGEIIDEQE